VGESFTTSENYFFLPAIAAARAFGYAAWLPATDFPICRTAAGAGAGLSAREAARPTQQKRPAEAGLFGVVPISRQ
jgi:hypothetical protein